MGERPGKNCKDPEKLSSSGGKQGIYLVDGDIEIETSDFIGQLVGGRETVLLYAERAVRIA